MDPLELDPEITMDAEDDVGSFLQAEMEEALGPASDWNPTDEELEEMEAWLREKDHVLAEGSVRGWRAA